MSEILWNHHVLAVRDVRRSARFYVDILGFSIIAEPDGWIFVARDECVIMLGECPNDVPASELGSHSYFAYLRVSDVDALYAELRAKEADILSDIETKPWRMREFSLRTVDGHRITVGQWMEE